MIRKHHLRSVRNKPSRKLDYVLLGVVLLTAFAFRFWLNGVRSGLLFALINTAAIGLIYVIGKYWSNRKTGLLAAAFFAVSQLTMFQGQLPNITTPWPVSIVDCLRYSMYDSYLLIFATGLLVVLPFILGRWNKKMRIIGWVSIGGFLVFPYIFFPFLIISLFSFYRPSTMTKTQTVLSVVGLLFIGSCALFL